MLTRRSIFAVFGGAAAAGPKIAKGIAENVAEGVSGQPPDSFLGGMMPAGNGDWKPQRIATLRHLLKSDAKEETKSSKRLEALYHSETIERVRLDSLRSVAPAHKLRMLVDGNTERRRRLTLTQSEFELSDLLDPTKYL